MLEIADKIASIASAALTAVGLVLSAVGLWLQFRPRSCSPPAAQPSDQPAGSSTASAVPRRLEVPDRSGWVPSPEYLPPQPGMQQQAYGTPVGRHRRVHRVLVIGLVTLGLAALGFVLALVL